MWATDTCACDAAAGGHAGDGQLRHGLAAGRQRPGRHGQLQQHAGADFSYIVTEALDSFTKILAHTAVVRTRCYQVLQLPLSVHHCWSIVLSAGDAGPAGYAGRRPHGLSRRPAADAAERLPPGPSPAHWPQQHGHCGDGLADAQRPSRCVMCSDMPCNKPAMWSNYVRSSRPHAVQLTFTSQLPDQDRSSNCKALF